MVRIEFVDVPAQGRVVRRERRVRLGDVTPTGRVRFDALARYLQDIARDDSADSALENPMGWLVRRTAIQVHEWPRFQEALMLDTWCSGIGPRWAERRTTVRGEHGGHVEAVTIWVHVDATTGRPARLVAGFAERYAEAARGRGADAKLIVPAVPDATASRRPWPLRHADYDVIAHVNNAAYWTALEELLGELAPLDTTPAFGVVEHRQPVAPGTPVELAATAPGDQGAFGWWWLDGGEVAAAGWFSRGVVAFSADEAQNGQR
jgi:acyl-ACP thioesterase